MIMKISDLLNITYGELINEPFVQAIEGATVFPSKVEHGDLFIAAEKEHIESAIANGAYAIIFDGELPDGIEDNEIAWIRVKSVKDAAIRLLRYVLLHKEADFYLLKPHEMSFLKMITTHKKNIKILPDVWTKAFEAILNGDEHLFISTDRELLETIYPDYNILSQEANGYMISDTLFRSTFKVGEYIYQDREMAPFHLEHLLKVVYLCDKHQLPYSIDRVRYTKHFKPIFIDAKLSIIPRGNSDRVVIFCDNLEDIIKAKKYVREQTTWTKSIILTPPKIKIEGLKENPIWFSNEKEVREVLKKSHYNYAFIYSLDSDILKDIKEEQSLF